MKPVEVRVAENAEGFVMELWGNVPDVFTVSVRSPGGETIPSIRLGIQDSITYSFVYERTKITVAGTLVEPSSGEEMILLRVAQPTPGIWTFLVEAVGSVHNGSFHMWLPITQFMSAPAYFLEASPYITLTEPAMARDVISVSTYNAANNSFYIDSGRGFTRNNVVAPDFAAPGVDVSGAGRPAAPWPPPSRRGRWRSSCSGRWWRRTTRLWPAGRLRITLSGGRRGVGS